MLIVAKKVRPRRLCLWMILAAAAVGVLGAGAGVAREARDAQTAAQVRADPTGIRSNEDRVAYLQKWGWITGEEPASVEEVLIPETFDASYDDYLALQKGQGFDLTAYAGKTVKRYTYAVSNYPGLRQDVWACLLVYKKTIIGGEVFCSQGDGFTQGLAYPQGTSTGQSKGA